MREGYKSTELGEIPIDWKVKKLDELFSFSGGLSLSRDKQSDTGVYYLHYGDIHKNNKTCFDVSRDEDWLPKVDVDINDIKEETILNTGDIVFADASEDYEGIGKSVAIVNNTSHKFISGLHTIIAKPKDTTLSFGYKRYCFSIKKVRSQFIRLATGATVYGISKSNIKDIKIIVPSQEEQQKIADILSTVDEQLQNTESLIEKTKELKKGLMQRLLTKGILHTEFKESEVGVIPKEWEIKKIKDIFKVSSGNFLSQKNIVEGDYPVYGGNGITGYHNEYLYENPKIVIGRVGAKCGCVCVSEPKSWITDNALFITEKIAEFEDGYMFYLLSYMNLNQYANQNAQPVISGQKIYELIVALPNIEEQRQITNIIAITDEYITQYKEKKENLQQLKKGLMQKLLTGKLRVEL